MVYEGPLGRLEATDDRHLQRYSLTTETLPVKPTPVVIGIPWYKAFDRPEEIRTNLGVVSWIGRGSDLGAVRGGHAICIKPPALTDILGWWSFYDQGKEGACVGFAISRMMGLLNRRRSQAAILYREAQRVDEWPGEAYSGTSVRAGCDVARDRGLWRLRKQRGTPSYITTGPHPEDGISANRWARATEEIATCLSPEDNGQRVLDAGYVSLLNSWGRRYPHIVRLPLATLERVVFAESGDATVVTDR